MQHTQRSLLSFGIKLSQTSIHRSMRLLKSWLMTPATQMSRAGTRVAATHATKPRHFTRLPASGSLVQRQPAAPRFQRSPYSICLTLRLRSAHGRSQFSVRTLSSAPAVSDVKDAGIVATCAEFSETTMCTVYTLNMLYM